jgi:pSer/pThr/pTyr-binding forkhead associated (FHA) protein
MLTTVQFTIVEGPDEGTRYEFLQTEIGVGSGFSNDLILSHPEIASNHFRIVEEKEEIYLEDLGSGGGIKLNGLFVSQGPLHNGDELQVGPYVFHISLLRDEISDEFVKGLQVLEGSGGKPSVWTRPPVLALLSVLLIVLVYSGVRLSMTEREGEDLSSSGPLPLPVHDIIGHKVGGKNYVDKAEFTFFAQKPKYRLRYRPGYVSYPQLVGIYLNDEKLANVPLTIDRWADELVLVDIPRNEMKMGEVNTIRFDNKKNPPEKTRWGIREISIHEVPIPKCDIEVAQKYLRLAHKKYEERRIHDPNLHAAIQYLKEGLEYVIACEDAQVRDVLIETMDRYEAELQGKYEDFLFNTKKFLKLRDLEAVTVELQNILSHVPDESDRRHRAARDLLEKIEK